MKSPMIWSRLSRVVMALVAAGLVAGCTTNTPVQPVGPPPSQDRPTQSATEDLSEQRRAAGIADCPVSDPDVPARPDGLPDVTLDCLGGGEQVRLAGLRGEPMLINVWAQWCGPCRVEAPFLREAAEARPDVMFFGVDFDDPNPEAAIAFAGEAGWAWPQVADPEKLIASQLQVIGPPQSFLVNADGRVVHIHRGMVASTEQLVELLDEHLRV